MIYGETQHRSRKDRFQNKLKQRSVNCRVLSPRRFSSFIIAAAFSISVRSLDPSGLRSRIALLRQEPLVPLLLWADIGARFVRWPFESPTGVVTAVIGAPFFILLARRQKVSG